MFCRTCHYDLRGQIDPRCPECGRAFLFDQPNTFLHHVLTWPELLSLVFRFLGLGVLRAVLLLLMIASYLAVPSLTHCGGYVTVAWTSRNLDAVLKEWNRQCSGVIDCKLDSETARRQIGRRMSPVADRAQLSARWHWENELQDRPMRFAGPALFGGLLGLTFRGRLRRSLILASLSPFVFTAMGCAFSKRLGELRYPGSYAFLDDFVYLEPPFAHVTDEWDPNFVLVAYERSGEYRNTRLVGTASGFVTSLYDTQIEDFLSCPQPESFQLNPALHFPR